MDLTLQFLNDLLILTISDFVGDELFSYCKVFNEDKLNDQIF